MIGIGGISSYDVNDDWKTTRAKLESIGLTTIGSILTRMRMAKVEFEHGGEFMVKKKTCAIHIFPPRTINYIGPVDDESMAELIRLVRKMEELEIVEVLEGPEFSDSTIDKINKARTSSSWYQIVKLGVGWNVKVKSRVPPEFVSPLTKLDPIGCVMAWDYNKEYNEVEPPLVFVYDNSIKVLSGSNVSDYNKVKDRVEKILNAPLDWVWKKRKF